MAFLRFRYGIEFDNRLHDQLDCIKLYRQLDENQYQMYWESCKTANMAVNSISMVWTKMILIA